MKALIKTAEGVEFDAKLLRAVEERNDAQKRVLFDKIAPLFRGRPRGQDLRAVGPGLQAQHRRHARGAGARADGGALEGRRAVCRPMIPRRCRNARRIYGLRDDLLLCGTKEAALRGADALLIATEWKSFRAPILRRAEGRADHAGHLRWPQPVRPQGRRSPRHRIPLDRQNRGVRPGVESRKQNLVGALGAERTCG